nr:XRE family transcriptional regulator [Flavobacterium sp.]
DEKENKLEQVVKQNSPTPSNMEIIPDNLFSEIREQNPIPASDAIKIENQNSTKEPNSGAIDKIVIFYKNGTFKSYVPD